MTTDNKALADRLRDLAESPDRNYPDVDAVLREAAVALTASPQVGEGRGEVVQTIPSADDVCQLHRLAQMLENIKAKRWPSKDWDVDDTYVAANIGHAARCAEMHLPALRRVLGVLGDAIWEGGQRKDTAPQPQGDASGQVSGGGEVSTDEIIRQCEAVGINWIVPDADPDGFPGSFDMVTMAEMRALFAALSPTQARHVGESDFESWYESHAFRGQSPKQLARDAYAAGLRDEPAPTADGGAVNWRIDIADGGSSVWCDNESTAREQAFELRKGGYACTIVPIFAHPAPQADVARLVEAMNAALNEADSRICRHETTHRGGAIWEICDDCGQQWADDRGGRKPDNWPDLLDSAYEALATFTAAQEQNNEQ